MGRLLRRRPGPDGGATAPTWLGRRFYDPAAGRFLTRDPAGYGGGVNLYAYCGNNPVNLCDPSGLWEITIGVGEDTEIPLLGPLGLGHGKGLGISFDSNGNVGISGYVQGQLGLSTPGVTHESGLFGSWSPGTIAGTGSIAGATGSLYLGGGVEGGPIEGQYTRPIAGNAGASPTYTLGGGPGVGGSVFGILGVSGTAYLNPAAIYHNFVNNFLPHNSVPHTPPSGGGCGPMTPGCGSGFGGNPTILGPLFFAPGPATSCSDQTERTSTDPREQGELGHKRC